MEVKPVVAVVTQKLADTLSEESVADNKVMIHQLKGVQRSLQKLQSFSSDQLNDLRVLYEVEDEIEKFTFQVARQRKRYGFLMKHTFFFNNLNSCRRLKRKIKKIQSTISSSSQDHATSTTSGSNNSLSVDSVNDHDHDVDDHDDGDDFTYETNELTQKSSSAVWPISKAPNTPSPKRALARSFSTILHHQQHMHHQKKLTFRYSCKEDEMNIVGFNIQHPKQLSSFCYQEQELGVFGLNDDIKSLVTRLTHQTAMFVPIVGEEGSGKTTLARAVYKNRMIKDHFEFHDWISVTEEYTAEHIQSFVLKSTVAVEGKRYLIVVDGVGSYDVLQVLKGTFPDEKNGSKVIFTTRKNPEMMKLDPHIMSRLGDDESWKMFVNKMGKEKEADPIQITGRLKHKILSICNGSPQSIVLMAGLLSNNGIRKWTKVIHDGLCHDDVLSICYTDLSVHSKLCLLYLALFPKAYDIPVRRLLRLWLAEGFVKRKQRDQFPEDMVQKCFEDLVDRNMIQITKLRSDNSPRRCRLVSSLHEYLLPKAQDIKLFYIHRNSQNFEDAAGVRRMVQHISITGAVDRQQTQQAQAQVGSYTTFDPSLLRSYISFNFQRKGMPEKQVGTLLDRIISRDFALLRVLDLEGVYKTSLPDRLGTLCHLRYLGLRWTFLESLPESVGDLSYLETLDVKHTRVISISTTFGFRCRLEVLQL